MKKYKCGDCRLCVGTPNDLSDSDGYCLKMEMIVSEHDEACTLAEIIKENEHDEESVH